MGAKNDPQLSPAMDLAQAWAEWRDQIPDDERDKVASIVAQADLTSKVGVNALAQAILVEVFRGQVSPIVLQMAKPLIELIVFNIDSMHQAAGSRAAPQDVLVMLSDLKNRVPISVHYATPLPDKSPQVIENVDPMEQLDRIKTVG